MDHALTAGRHGRWHSRGALFAWLLLAATVAYVATAWYLWQYQRELIFLPSRVEAQTPAGLGLRYDDVWIRVRGTPASLHGWWLPAADAAAPAILYLHGNEENIGANVGHAARLHDLGFAVLLADYRGYGRSDGPFPAEGRVYEDAEAMWSYLTAVRGIDPRRLYIYGHSLGGAVAIHLAVRHPEAAGVIAEGTFTSIRDMARLRYWMFPVDALLHERFDSLSEVRRLAIPVLFVHGTADVEVPYTMSVRLFDAAPEPRSLVLIPDGAHEDSAIVGDARYARAMRDFTDGTRQRGSDTSGAGRR